MKTAKFPIARTALAALAAAGLAAGCAAASFPVRVASVRGAAAPRPATAVPASEKTVKSWPSSCPPGRRGWSRAAPAAGAAASSGAPGLAPALAAIQFAGPRHGWVAGAGRILATSDGGRAWHRQYDGPADLTQVDFIDHRHGWAAGGNTLLRTTDGGARWTALAEPCGRELVSVHFASPALGYAVLTTSGDTSSGDTSSGDAASAGLYTSGHGGTLARSTDGGAGWTTVAGAPANAQSVCFATAADGYLGTPGHVWRSTNGGRSWTLALAEPQPASGGTAATLDTPEIQCAGATGAWVLFLGQGAGMGHAPYLAYTTEDGHAWHALFEERYTESGLRPGLNLPQGPGDYPGPFSAISASTAAFVGYTPPVGYGAAPLELAAGGGRTLSRKGNVRAGINQPLATAFLSSARGWVVGENLRTRAVSIAATANSGRSWTTQYTTGLQETDRLTRVLEDTRALCRPGAGPGA